MKTLQLLFRGFVFALVCALCAESAHAEFFVTCLGTNNVQTLSSSGASDAAIPGGTLGRPAAIAIDAAGNVYVCNDQSPYFIEKFSSTGTDLGTFTAATSLNRPYGLAFDRSGNLYVANYGNNTIEKFSSAGADLGVFINSGISGPIGLAFDRSGILYVVNSGTNTIGKFSAAGVSVGAISSTSLSFPYRVAFDAAGNLYVTSYGNSLIEKFSSAGDDLGAFASTGLNGPSGLVFDASGNLYACNEDASNIEKYAPDGTDLGAFGNVAGFSATASDIAFYSGGQIEFSAAAYQTFEDAHAVTITVNRAGGSNGATSAAYTTRDGSAVAGTDYTAASGAVSWEDGDAAPKTFTVPILDRRITSGGSVSFSVVLLQSSGTGTFGTPAAATVTINDNDGASAGQLAFSAAAYPAFEDQGSVTITVNRTGGSSGATSVAYATSDGKAVAGADYTATSGMLSWADGDGAAKTFQVPILDRHIRTGASADFLVTLSQVAGAATLGATAQATVTINDNDGSSTGQIAFSAAAYPAFEDQGNVTITVNRTGNTNGATSVAYATSNGAAVAGADYTATSGTLSWADGDGAAKTFQVPILDRHITSGASADFLVTLSQVAGTATLGAPAQATVTIHDNEAPITEPVVVLDAPPGPLTVLPGARILLEANVNDLSNQLSTVQFLVNGDPVTTQNDTGYYAGGFMPSIPGSYQVEVQATALDGTVSSAAQSVTVVDPNGAVAAPQAALLAALDGLTVLAGTNLTVTVMSRSVNGQAVVRVNFYANGILFASDDGSGHPIMQSVPGRQPITRSAAPASVNTVFQATYQVPATSQPVSIVAVATNAAGISQPTASAHVKAAPESGTQPVVTLGAVTAPVGAGSSLTVPVTVSASTSPISMVQFYLNSQLVSTSTAAPYSFSVTPPVAGADVLTAIATDANGVSTVSAPLTIQVVPTVALSVKGDGKAVVGGENGKVVFTRAGDDLSAPLTVFFKLTGTAVDGVNYTHVGKKAVIPAGAATYKLKIKPLDTKTGPLALKVGVKLLPAPDGSYAPGNAVKAKLTLEQAQ